MSDLPIDPPSLYSSNPSSPSSISQSPEQLRERAESLLQKGSAPASLGYVLGSDTLAILYKLASAADSAGDSLKLLHELQTHQIELDLLHQQTRIFEQETAAELAHYKALYDYAPMGYFVLSREGRIMECNKSGAHLLGTAASELDGCLFQDQLAAVSRPLFSWKLKKLFSGASGESCTVHTVDRADANKLVLPALRVVATLAPNGEAVLLNLSMPESQPSESQRNQPTPAL